MKELIKKMREKLGEDVITESLETDLQAQWDVAINEAVQQKVAALETELEEKNAEEMGEFKSSLIESIDSYVEYAADEYMKENIVALESKSKVEAAEKIVEAAKAVFKEIGLEIPEEEVQIVKSLEADLEEAQDKLNDSVSEILESKKQIFEYEKAVSFMKKTQSLSESKIEEVHDLMEGLEYKDIKDFEKKVDIVIEKVTKFVVKEDKTDNFENLDELEEDVVVTNDIDKYLK